MGPLLAALVPEVVGDVLSFCLNRCLLQVPTSPRSQAWLSGLADLWLGFAQQEGPLGNLPFPSPLPRCLCCWGSASDLPVAFRPSSQGPALPLAGAS